ncbi:lectin-like domain-containing protein [Streptomyces sp. NBC_01304]|uniref:lectin-like domain-containing protein n=1 Tax=Streptomyces sp. NBC_01304 TaxID=2903818 RepID=UPI002E148BBD|nr:hypothetical protein OG430_42670 [Streptomyces sp. NBC_01304]
MTMGLSLVTAQSATAEVIANEPFTGPTVDQTKWYGGPYKEGDPTGWACLTASTATPKPLEGCQEKVGDKPGQGALRLTSNKKLQNGYAISKNPITTRSGTKFSIDFGIYDPMEPGDPADGIALMLLDGAAEMPTKSGKNGSGLGYVGIEGGYLGIGLDVYGNFTDSHNDAGAVGGLSERTGNSITIRGASSVKNPMVATYKSGRKLAAPGATNRAEARRTAIVELSSEGVVTVHIDFHDGTEPREVIEPVDLDEIKGQPKVPDTLRIGVAASTGDSTAVHELWNGKVETIEPNLVTKVVPTGPVKAGEPAEFEMTTSNAKAAGPTHGDIVTTQTFPEGIKPVSASGDGWDCSVAGQTVTCKRPGSGPDALKPGDAKPPVLVKTEVAKDAKGDKEITSGATTPGESDPKPETSPVSVTPVKGPDLTVTTKPKGDVTAGEPAEYQIDVANKPEAGPTDGEVKVVRTFPEGIKPTEAAGEGWDCKIDGQTVTCTRPGTGDDVLDPGKNYPPINVKTDVDDDASGDLDGTTQVTTPSAPNTTPVKDTTKVNPAAKDPNLSVVTEPVGDVVAGKPAKWAIGVGNAPDAGPTTGEVKVVRTFPEGVKPVAANGDGWDCKIDGQTVTCTRPGTGDDALQPGKNYPPINVDTEVDKGAKGDLTGTTEAGTPGQDTKPPVKDTVSVIPASAKEPDLSVVTKPVGDVVAGKPAEFNIDVSNAPDAGPTHDSVKVVRTFPEGVVPKVAQGAGWDCKIDGQTVTCTRPGTGDDALQPGKQYPPIKVTTAVGNDVSGTVEGTTGVGTKGDPDGDKTVKDSVDVKAGGDGTAGAGVSCYGGMARISMKPGLGIGDKTQSFTGAGTSSGCTSSDSKLAPASVQVSFNGIGKGSCVPALGIPNATMTGVMRWYVNGKILTSKVEGTSKLTLSGANFEGVVTDGAYKGNKVHATADWDIAANIIPGAAHCLLGGYTDATGTWNSVTVDVG